MFEGRLVEHLSEVRCLQGSCTVGTCVGPKDLAVSLVCVCWEVLCVGLMAASGSSAAIEFAPEEIGFPGMAEEWEKCASVRSRLRKGFSWLQFPIPNKGGDESSPNESPKNETKNPHSPTTRALELNFEVLNGMLNAYPGEFIDVERLTKEARFVEVPGSQLETCYRGYSEFCLMKLRR